jgi:phosphatidyl-myo-inositol dimannoside synthase
MLLPGKKILLITSEFPPNVGGIGNHGYNLASALQREGYQVTVLADVIDIPQSQLETFRKKQAFTIRYILRNNIVINTYFKRVSLALQLSRKADLVICSGKYPLWMGALIRFISASKKLVAVVHGSELDIKQQFTRKLVDNALRKFTCIVAVSAYTAAHLPKRLPVNISQHIIHNGINTDEFRNVRMHRLPGEPALLTVGSVTNRKGQENVVRALPAIRKKFAGVRYHIIGKPVVQKQIEAVASNLGVAEVLQFHGAVDRVTLLERMGGATIKLMLSNHTTDGDFEGFGIAVLEANAFSIPVIGSRNSGIADAIVDGKTGILVDPKNAEEIVSAIETIMNNYDYYSSNAKEWAQQHDWKLIVKQYLQVINN